MSRERPHLGAREDEVQNPKGSQKLVTQTPIFSTKFSILSSPKRHTLPIGV